MEEKEIRQEEHTAAHADKSGMEAAGSPAGEKKTEQ